MPVDVRGIDQQIIDNPKIHPITALRDDTVQYRNNSKPEQLEFTRHLRAALTCI
jgi:hypothetical protein